MRARIPVPQSRRGLLVAVAILVTVLVAAGCGSGGSKDRSLKLARFPGYRLSFRYPSTWQRKDWCWIYTDEFPLTLLTTANPVPDCQPSNLFGFGTTLPPPQALGKDGVAVWWIASPGRALVGVTLRRWRRLHSPILAREAVVLWVAIITGLAGAASGGVVGLVTWGIDGFVRFATVTPGIPKSV